MLTCSYSLRWLKHKILNFKNRDRHSVGTPGIKMNDTMQVNNKTKQIIIVCGSLCSGKGYFCKKYFPEYQHICISDIVKQLTNMQTRSELATTKHFDKSIADTLILQITNSDHSKIIIDGIRQLYILQSIEHAFGTNVKEIIWLNTKNDVRRERFEKRKSEKDDQTYEQATAGDVQLGIQQVENYIRHNFRVVNS
jgi:dephospho-CoA kinase